MPMINVNEQELAFLLAAGRMAQHSREFDIGLAKFPGRFYDVATDCGEIDLLPDDQVDDLLERMNFEGGSNE